MDWDQIMAEEARLERAYWNRVGWALQYGILVYHPGTGGEMKSLGELDAEIAAHRGQKQAPFPLGLGAY
jgi:hypothetical protein